MTNLSSIVDIFSTSFHIFSKGWRIFLVIGFLDIVILLLVNLVNWNKIVSITFIDSNLVADCFLSGLRSGAINIAASKIYIGAHPTIKKILEKWWIKKWSIFQYYFFIYPSLLFILDKIDDPKGNSSSLFEFINKETSVVVGSLLHATVAIILIENKSPLNAVHRSVTLCGRNIILSFTTITFNLILVRFMQNVLLEDIDLGAGKYNKSYSDDGFLLFKMFLFALFLFLLFLLGKIVFLVLYITMRMKTEGLHRNQFANEVQNI